MWTDLNLSACSSTPAPSLSTVIPVEPNLPAVMGVSDWDFLQPPSPPLLEQEDTSHRPSLDDFDGEIAVFQVHNAWRLYLRADNPVVTPFLCR